MLIFVGCLYLWGAFIRNIQNCSECFSDHICAALAAFYTTGMTVALMDFVLEPLDCLLQCYESVK